jgi:hypothetical protein
MFNYVNFFFIYSCNIEAPILQLAWEVRRLFTISNRWVPFPLLFRIVVVAMVMGVLFVAGLTIFTLASPVKNSNDGVFP